MHAIYGFQPDALAATAASIAETGSRLSVASAAAAGSTTRVTPAAADEVSAAIATLFGSYGHEYRALIAQAAAFHAQFAREMTTGAALYANAEAANASRLQSVAQEARSLVTVLTGATGAHAAPKSGAAGHNGSAASASGTGLRAEGVLGRVGLSATGGGGPARPP